MATTSTRGVLHESEDESPVKLHGLSSETDSLRIGYDGNVSDKLSFAQQPALILKIEAISRYT